MGLNSAMNTSLNGLALSEKAIDVLGNNISNAGTNGFKASNVLFTTQLVRTLSSGAGSDVAQGGTSGGTNPTQVGLGATLSTIKKDFSQGSITSSSNATDLAIQGDGFFILNGSDGKYFTRNGNFSLNGDNMLVTESGMLLQGFPVGEAGEINRQASLTNVEIPLGVLARAQQTSKVAIGGAVRSSGTIATQGSLLTSAAMVDGGGAAVTDTTLLTDVRLASAPATTLFSLGAKLEFEPNVGGRILGLPGDPPLVTATTTVGDLTSYMSDTLAINGSADVLVDPGSGLDVGVALVGGQIRVVGNRGTVNDITITGDHLTANAVGVNLGFQKTQTADGESTLTDFVAYDSLGEKVPVTVSMYLESQDSNVSTFRYLIASKDEFGVNQGVSSGTVSFGSGGQVVASSSEPFGIPRDGEGVVTPMEFSLNFDSMAGTAPAEAGNAIRLVRQDGAPPGALSSFVIDDTGLINGQFSNGLIAPLGQVALARFPNTQGLIEAGAASYTVSASSGEPIVDTAGNLGLGNIQAGAIELSNTDIGRNLVDLIMYSTNYRGNARIISSIQQLVNELLVIGR